MARGEHVVALAALALAVIASVMTWQLKFLSDLGPGPGFFPRSLGGILVALSVYLLWRLSTDREATDESEGMPPRAAVLRILAVYAAMVGCFILLELVGFVPAAFLFFMVTIVAVERTPVPIGLAASIITTAFFYLVFHVALQVQLPTGMIAF